MKEDLSRKHGTLGPLPRKLLPVSRRLTATVNLCRWRFRFTEPRYLWSDAFDADPSTWDQTCDRARNCPTLSQI